MGHALICLRRVALCYMPVCYASVTLLEELYHALRGFAKFYFCLNPKKWIELALITRIVRFSKISIQATAQMAGDKEAIVLSKVHTNQSKCNLLFRDNCLFCDMIYHARNVLEILFHPS